MNKFKTAWDDYNKSSYKKKVLMDQVSILSVKKINDGVVYLYEISPMLLRGYPYEEERRGNCLIFRDGLSGCFPLPDLHSV